MARGRRPIGPRMAQKLTGPTEAKERLEVILDTIAGGRSIEEACDQLGISEAQFHRLRERAMQAALEALQPRPAGRPSNKSNEDQGQVEELEQQIQDLRIGLRAAQTREEIALAMPHLLKEKREKKMSKQTKHKKRKRS